MNASHPIADLSSRRCARGAPALDDAALAALLPLVPDWRVDAGRLVREFTFRDFHETIAFVNALAWIVHREDHHPHLSVGYDRCTVRWITHSAGNRVSENDVICAAKADALVAGRTA